MPWSKFLKAHWEAIAAAAFFTVEVWTGVGFIRYLVFFVIDLSTRRVEIAGIMPVPNGPNDEWGSGAQPRGPFSGFATTSPMMPQDEAR